MNYGKCDETAGTPCQGRANEVTITITVNCLTFCNPTRFATAVTRKVTITILRASTLASLGKTEKEDYRQDDLGAHNKPKQREPPTGGNNERVEQYATHNIQKPSPN